MISRTKRNNPILVLTAVLLLTAHGSFSQESAKLKVDPLVLVSLKECWNIAGQIGDELYPGCDFHAIPVLIYRPNVQEILINFPHKPKGFSEYTGFIPLNADTVFVRNDKTTYEIDDQNTSTKIDGIPALVVADSASRVRSHLLQIIKNRPKEFATKWAENWGFIQDPYSLLQLILHEAFHAHQNRMSPGKDADENIASQYPILDPVNNALFVLEARIVRDALLSKDSETKLQKIKQFAAVRSFRQSRLGKDLVEYENLSEYSEGLARYVEYKFLQVGEKIKPVREMYYLAGFNGYQGILGRRFEIEIEGITRAIAVDDERFANRFGAGPMKWRLYATGAAQALFLDQTMRGWKEKIFDGGVYLSDLLTESVNLSRLELEKCLAMAKAEYRYDEALEDKLQFERKGRKQIEDRLSAITHTDRSLVKIVYGESSENLSIGFTVFGVTPIDKERAIYDLVPIRIAFGNGAELKFKHAVPVLVDRGKRMVIFAADLPATDSEAGLQDRLENDVFILSAAGIDIRREGSTITIRLK